MKKLSNTIASAVNFFKEELKNNYDISELDQIIKIVFLHYFRLSRTDLILRKEEVFVNSDFQKITGVIELLKEQIPLAQIIGEWEFYGLSLKVNEHTLIPRPETEELVQFIISESENVEHLNVLDIGTGTGCIAIALKNEMNLANVVAYDISSEALKIASGNAMQNKLEIEFNQVDILEWKNQDIRHNDYDVIVSNPPYITQKEKELMHKNVLDYEPHLALFVENETPLIFYDAIAEFSLKHLTSQGRLYFEINEHYGVATKQLLIDKEFKNINIVKDMNGKDRIVSCEIN